MGQTDELRSSLTAIQNGLGRGPETMDAVDDCARELDAVATAVTAALEVEYSRALPVEPAAA